MEHFIRATGASEEEEEEADSLGPSKPALKYTSEDEEVLFEADPSKIMVFKDKVWGNRGGKGRTVVSRDKKTGKSHIVLRAGTTGNLYFNAPLNSTMRKSLTRVKKSVSLVTISYSMVDGKLTPDNDNKLSIYQIRVKTEAEADKLYQALEKAME